MSTCPFLDSEDEKPQRNAHKHSLLEPPKRIERLYKQVMNLGIENRLIQCYGAMDMLTFCDLGELFTHRHVQRFDLILLFRVLSRYDHRRLHTGFRVRTLAEELSVSVSQASRSVHRWIDLEYLLLDGNHYIVICSDVLRSTNERRRQVEWATKSKLSQRQRNTLDSLSDHKQTPLSEQ